MTRTILLSLLSLIILFIGFSNGYAELYSGGPWRGRVIDADTKEPIEGAVVVAVWERRYDCGFSNPTFFHEAKEVLTDKEGLFEIPTYIEEKGKLFWRSKDYLNDPTSILICSGPEIRNPNFIIYKPSYGGYPEYVDLYIFAIGPSKVEYLDEYEEIYKEQLVKAWKRKTKTFPEGVAYYGKRCLPKIKALNKSVFDIEGFFTPLPDAQERIKNLNVPLDCPVNGEIIPDIKHGYKSDIKPMHEVMENKYIIIELAKLKTKEERLRAIPSGPTDIGEDKLPLLYKLINEENRHFGLGEVGRKQQ